MAKRSSVDDRALPTATDRLASRSSATRTFLLRGLGETALLGRGPSRRLVDAPPEIPRCNRAMGRPGRADFVHAVSVRHFPQPIRELDRLPNTEIELRQHVGSAEAEHKEHVRGPPTNALHGGKRGDHALVVQFVQLVDRELAGRDAIRQVPKVSYLLAGQSGGAQLFVRSRQQAGGRRRAVEEGYETTVDGCGRATGQLLLYDSAENVVEVRPFGANGKSTRADVRHDASEHRIAAEMADCAAVHGLEYVTLGEARRTAVARRELGGAAGTRTLDSRNARARFPGVRRNDSHEPGVCTCE